MRSAKVGLIDEQPRCDQYQRVARLSGFGGERLNQPGRDEPGNPEGNHPVAHCRRNGAYSPNLMRLS